MKSKKQYEEAEAEATLLDEIKARCDNWERCYRDRPRKNISITLAAMDALKKALYDPKKAEEETYQSEQSDPYRNVLDQKDADILQEVWSYMGHDGEADLTIGNTGMNVATAKTIIALYTFGGKGLREQARKRAYHMRRRQFGEWEKQALLFFLKRIRVYENIK